MLYNYITIAWRNLSKNKLFSFINIFGLSVGIAFTMLIAAYVWHEWSVNHDLRNADNQYIIQSEWKDPSLGYELTALADMPKALKEQYPNLVANYYHWDGVSSTVSKGDLHFRESLQVGDSTFLSMYGFKMLHGDAGTALNQPFTAVITEQTAVKYFGTTDVVGQTLSIENFKGSKHDFMVTGVMAKFAKNSVTNVIETSNSSIFLPASAAKFMGRSLDGWKNTALVGLIELKNGVKPQDLDGPMRSLIKKNAPENIAANLTPKIVPLKSFYLEFGNGAVKKMLFTLSFIALFILLMAVINFVNICISRSSQRMKEMGIRKVLGGLREQLIWQFLTESIVLVLIATVLAFGIYVLAKPYFANILATDIGGLFSFPLYSYFIMIIFALLMGLVAGIYPALVLSALKSVDSLKGKLNQVKDNAYFRKGLIAFQFTTACVVLISAIVISKQISLFFGKNLGFDKDYVVYAQVPRDWSKPGVQKMEDIRRRLAELPQIKSVSLSWEIPDGGASGGVQAYKTTDNPNQAFNATTLLTDNTYAETYSLSMKAGKFFKPQYIQADSNLVVINEAQSKALGFGSPAEAVGKQFNSVGMNAPMTISGVTGDFIFGGMGSKTGPITFMNVNGTPFYRYFSIKLRPGNMEQNLAAVQKKWAEVMPGAPFEYNFIDDMLAKMYKTELQLKKASYLATGLAIIIVLLGVLGLISLSIQKRTKEIGVRKVLGATEKDVVILFLKDFTATIVFAVVLACPLAYWLMHTWLNGYAYKVALTPQPFVIAFVALLALTSVLISLQTVKAALANPIKSLRTE
ncbi:FtsX-like permease family protein [Mucilaginibacter achroorhodeus]|uniref:FtsX-like permease family protein n=1 Tax=Mucilaginibacter achroorhodeus TaxID=2599294 RepID=A0A563U0Q8_9SPHI|nr:ABC transporter permease [Mucilaginibacter achroorhodeus]TWR24592.1 FtsX-like permease family protein [Mucilaginibacter achroorhodeus]